MDSIGDHTLISTDLYFETIGTDDLEVDPVITI